MIGLDSFFTGVSTKRKDLEDSPSTSASTTVTAKRTKAASVDVSAAATLLQLPPSDPPLFQALEAVFQPLPAASCSVSHSELETLFTKHGGIVRGEVSLSTTHLFATRWSKQVSLLTAAH